MPAKLLALLNDRRQRKYFLNPTEAGKTMNVVSAECIPQYGGASSKGPRI